MCLKFSFETFRDILLQVSSSSKKEPLVLYFMFEKVQSFYLVFHLKVKDIYHVKQKGFYRIKKAYYNLFIFYFHLRHIFL
jgi:hypothetical protein